MKIRMLVDFEDGTPNQWANVEIDNDLVALAVGVARAEFVARETLPYWEQMFLNRDEVTKP